MDASKRATTLQILPPEMFGRLLDSVAALSGNLSGFLYGSDMKRAEVFETKLRIACPPSYETKPVPRAEARAFLRSSLRIMLAELEAQP